MKKNPRTPDFRYIYSNGLQMQFNGNEVTLIFGIKEDQSNVLDDGILEHVGVIMTPVSAKLLATTLLRTIEHFEATNNIQIPIDPIKTAYLENVLKEAEKQSANPSPLSSSPPS